MPATAVSIEDENDLLKITPLGAGREVGRSCIVLQYKGKTVMLDCGLHAGRSGNSSLPFLDEIDPATVDILLVSHFHIDHAAAVPHYLERTSFKGRTFMTRPTKGVFRWLATDYIRVTNTSNSDTAALYTEEDLVNAHAKIEEIDVHQQVEVNGIKFTAFNAGHVLGAAMFLIEIAGVKVLYTGDYSREEDRHLVQAENPGVAVNVLITESTYGVQSHHPRVEREREFMNYVRDVVVRRRGCCLMPVTALGRTQELLLILEEHWGKYSRELDNVPIFFISALGKTGTRLYQAYIMHMNQRIQRQFNRTGRNPFDFRYIKTRTNLAEVPDSGPCVVLASPGMLQSGISRKLLERWAPRPENGLIITGYSVEGTLARTIVNGPDAIPALAGGKDIQRRMSVKNVSFSAHVDYSQNSAFIDELRAPHVVLVHGEENAMRLLRANLTDKYKNTDYEISIHTPRNIHTVKLHFHGEKMARVMGSLANRMPQDGECASGILVERDFNYTIVDPVDLHEFTNISPVIIEQQLRVPYASTPSLLQYHLEQMFGTVQEAAKETSNDGVAHTMRVYDAVDIHHYSWKTHVEIEWEGSAMNDMVADSVIAVILNVESSPASVKLTQSSCSHGSHSQPQQPDKGVGMGISRQSMDQAIPINRLLPFLKQQFNEVELEEDQKHIVVCLNGHKATVNTESLNINTESQPLRARLGGIIGRIRRTLRPIARRTEPLPLPEPEPMVEESDKADKIEKSDKEMEVEEEEDEEDVVEIDDTDNSSDSGDSHTSSGSSIGDDIDDDIEEDAADGASKPATPFHNDKD